MDKFKIRNYFAQTLIKMVSFIHLQYRIRERVVNQFLNIIAYYAK